MRLTTAFVKLNEEEERAKRVWNNSKRGEEVGNRPPAASWGELMELNALRTGVATHIPQKATHACCNLPSAATSPLGLDSQGRDRGLPAPSSVWEEGESAQSSTFPT